VTSPRQAGFSGFFFQAFQKKAWNPNPANAGIKDLVRFLLFHSRYADCVTIGKTTHIGDFVIPGLTRARSEALALSIVFSDCFATGCRIKSGMTG
jgi:hypothetical protein